MKKAKLAILSHFAPLQWENIGKVANQVKLAIPSQSELLRYKKIGKVAKQAKLVIPSHSVPLLWEKIGKVRKQAKLAVPSCKMGEIGHSKSFCTISVGKDWKSCKQVKLAIWSHSAPHWWEKIGKVVKQAKIGCSESFFATPVRKDWKSCKMGEIGHSEPFCTPSVGKD